MAKNLSQMKINSINQYSALMQSMRNMTLHLEDLTQIYFSYVLMFILEK